MGMSTSFWFFRRSYSVFSRIDIQVKQNLTCLANLLMYTMCTRKADSHGSKTNKTNDPVGG